MENEIFEMPSGPQKQYVRVVASKKEEFEERVKKLSEKLKKEIKVEFKGIRKHTFQKPGGEDGEPIIFEVSFAHYELEVDLQYSVNGYTFFGMIKDDGANPIVISLNPEAFKRLNLDRVFKCPYCNKTIQNRKTKVYLEKDGELFAFGSSCAAEYFGDSYKYLTKNLGFFAGFEEDLHFYAQINENDVEKFYNTVALAIHAFKSGIEFKKLVKNHKDEWIEIKAKDRIQDVLSWYPSILKSQENSVLEMKNTLIGAKYLDALKQNPNITEDVVKEFEKQTEAQIQEKIEKIYNVHIFGEDSKEKMDIRKVIKDIIQGEDFKNITKFYEEMNPSDNFGFNLKNQFQSQGNLVGILVYGVYKYFWDTAKKNIEPKEKETWNRFPGEVGDEVKNLKVKLLRFTSFETGFGSKYVYTFVTENKEQITIFFTGMLAAHNGYDFSSSNPRGGTDGYFEGAEWIGVTRENGEFFRTGVKFEAGMDFVIKKAKIKEQKDYKGTPQTVLKLSRANQVWKV